jgi:SH3-like domain-containing protein
MQSIQALRLLPVVACIVVPLSAQAGARVTTQGEWFYQTAAGRRLAQLEVGSVVQTGAVQGDWTNVTLDGWIIKTSLGPTAIPGFDVAVSQQPSENLRATPAGAVIAHLAAGFALDKVAEQDRWVHVRRSGWVKTAALSGIANAVQPPPARVLPTRAPDTTPTPVDPARVLSSRPTTLYRAPDGASDAALTAGAPLRVLGRTSDWTRVELEGWVKTSDLQAAPSGVLVGVSAAELRAEPDRYVGQSLRWTLQVIAVRTADDLRPDIPTGSLYLLARGPMPEHGFIYVVVPDAQRTAVQGLAPLATIQSTVRVRTGRSKFVGNPVVDLVSLEVLP